MLHLNILLKHLRHLKGYLSHKKLSLIEKFYLIQIRYLNKNKKFTIISNNCWGGSVYEDLGLQYYTPTIGLFFFTPCYLKLISNLEKNILSDLIFIDSSKYEKGNNLVATYKYPIGLLNGDIEVHFLHYKNKEDALLKWTRRVNRINWDQLYISFTDNEETNINDVKYFDSLNYKKIFFTSKHWDGIRSQVVLNSFKGQENIGNIYDNRWLYRKDFNVVKWLNS